LNSEVFEQLGLTAEQIDSLLGILRTLRTNAGDF